MVDFPLDEPAYTNKRRRDLSAFDAALAAFPAARAAQLDDALANATILDIQAMFGTGELTSAELVTYYADRIRRYDIDKLNAVMELNPAALTIATECDRERAAGAVRGPMHGIPVLLKDNIATGDGLHATAGAYALRDWQPGRDAFLVQQLRSAGAIILGKANLSEWANWMDPAMPNGFSTLGGQTRNPYGPFDPLGSSSGSAVAVAANLVTVSIGSETSGSIISPAAANSVVGLKTSHGLVSADYVIPLVDWLDVTGPMGRSVTDVAILLTAMTGVEDAATAPLPAAQQELDYVQFAAQAAARGLTVAVPVYAAAAVEARLAGLAQQSVPIDDGVREAIQAEIKDRGARLQSQKEILTMAGLTIVEVAATEAPTFDRALILQALEFGFQAALADFAAAVGPDFPIRSLADVVEINRADLANRAPYGQSRLEESATTAIRAEDDLARREEGRAAAADALQAVLRSAGADLLLIDETMSGYPIAGFPAISLPIGYDDAGQPVDLRLTGGFLSEPQLIAAAYAVEQATRARCAPLTS